MHVYSQSSAHMSRAMAVRKHYKSFVHFFAVFCKTTALNDWALRILENTTGGN